MNEFSFRDVVLQKMKKDDISQEMLAKDSGVSQSTISRILKIDGYNTTIKTKNAILKALKLPVINDASYLDGLLMDRIRCLSDSDKKAVLRWLLLLSNASDLETQEILKSFNLA